jgi:hypothetical protein
VSEPTERDCKASYTATVFGLPRRYWCQINYGHMGPHNDGALATGFVKEWRDPKQTADNEGTQ